MRFRKRFAASPSIWVWRRPTTPRLRPRTIASSPRFVIKTRAAGDETKAADPLTALAEAVWAGGAMDLDLLPPPVADAIARGWLSSALDNELLARAGADVIAARETLRQRNRQLAELTKRENAPLDPPPPN